MGSHDEFRFTRPQFSPLPPVPGEESARYSINSLPELISYNALHNADLPFCMQGEAAAALRGGSELDRNSAVDISRSISFKELDEAISACCVWLEEKLVSSREGSKPFVGRPVALYLESDVGLFIYIAAMLASNIPVVLLSARLSALAVDHLLSETGASTLLVSPRTSRTLTQHTAELVTMVNAESYHHFLNTETSGKRPRLIVNENNRDVLILHSSGTTGLPKPIRLAHRYLLGYAACHNFAQAEETTWRNLSTLPLYHGFGLLAPCLSLSIGMTCCFPPSNTIPAAGSSLRLLDSFQAQSLMTVPSILEEMVSLEGDQLRQAMTSLAKLRFVAVGGGPIKQQVGEVLASNGVKLLNHYGVTEIGAIAPIFSPGEDYDWRYLRLRTDLGLQLRPLSDVEGDGAAGSYKLVGYPCGWDEAFEIQDELDRRSQSDHVEVRILGRRDDLIVLKTGEKVSPGLLEEALCQDVAVKTAVCIGTGFFELVLLVEPSLSAAALSSDDFVDHVWKIVANVNSLLDHHARISSKAAIIIKPPGKDIRRSDKGSVMRKEVQNDFSQEIQQAYEALEQDGAPSMTTLSLDSRDLEADLIDILKGILGNSAAACVTLGRDDDLFEIGLDSLGTTRLARAINSAVRQASSANGSTPPVPIKTDFVYRNPTLKLLLDALKPMLTGQKEACTEEQSREVQMRSLLSKLLDAPPDEPRLQKPDGGAIILTGSTGSLGVHVLQRLATSCRVSRVICLSRVGYRNGARLSKRARQEDANAAAEARMPSWAWDKVELLDANMQAPYLGIGEQEFSRLVGLVTHIVHLAWPMDFKRSLKSFEPHVLGTIALSDLAIAAHDASGGKVKPRVLFASSIAVLARQEQKNGIPVPEAAVENPLATAPMGYAEAKWVCEQILTSKGRQYAEKFDPLIVRIGQLSGAEEGGVWKVEEHFPALVKASHKISALPALQGSFSWLPVNRAAKVLVEMLFQENPVTSTFYHVENPIRQSNHDLVTILRHELNLKGPLLPFDVWLTKVRESGEAEELLAFFENDFERLSGGAISLDTQATRRVSPTLRGTNGMKKETIVQYMRRWRATGFIS